ncbi:MAG: hypothetical protein ACI8RZ_004189 [Myxococcota bacterium]|jgi:hypothetical protein
MPAWVIAASRAGEAYGGARESAAWQRLSSAIADDDNLTDLAEDLRADVLADPWSRAADIRYRLWAWSAYLDSQGKPWRLEGEVIDPGGGAFLYVKSYRVMADGAVVLADQRLRFRLLRRADSTSAVEGYLGHAGEGGGEGVLLLADRLAIFATDTLWPLLDSADDGRRIGLARAWAKPVRGEVAEILGDQVAPLTRTATHRRTLLAAWEGMQDRYDCMDYRIHRIPWQGLPDHHQALMAQLVARDAELACPAVTAEEHAAFVAYQEAIAAEPGVEAALEGLLAVAARPTALHETRHLADRSDPPTCTGCDLDPGDSVNELSAYLTSFAHPEVGHLALYQACRATKSGRGRHALAVSIATRHILPRGCANPPPDDLAARALAAEVSLFGRDQIAQIPADFPASVALR